MHRMTIDPAIALLIVAGAALLFARAALHKVRDLSVFEEVFAAYGVLPGSARPLARLLPLLELAVTVTLLIPQTRFHGTAAALLLLATYAFAIALNLLRGRRHISCGCGGPEEKTRIAPWMVLRNLLLAGGLATTLLPWTHRDLEPTDAVTGAFGLACLTLIYLATEQLMIHAERTFSQGGVR